MSIDMTGSWCSTRTKEIQTRRTPPPRRVTCLFLCLILSIVIALPSTVNTKIPHKHKPWQQHRYPALKRALNKNDHVFCNTISRAALNKPIQNHPGSTFNAIPSTIHTIIANLGIVDVVKNTICSKARLAKPYRNSEEKNKILVLAMDDEICGALKNDGFIGNTDFGDGHGVDVVCVAFYKRMIAQMKILEPLSFIQIKRDLKVNLKQMADWNTIAHKVLINAKLYALYNLLSCGFGAFISDADVVLFHDPLPVFSKIILDSRLRITMIFQGASGNMAGKGRDGGSNMKWKNLNTGFFYVLPSTPNRQFARAVIQNATWWHIDQARVNFLLASGNFTSPDSVYRLPQDQVPDGSKAIRMMRSHQYWVDKKTLLAFHANWTPDRKSKLNMLSKTGVWFLKNDRKTCYLGQLPSPFVP